MQKKKLILFIDSGDTIIDEATQIRNDEGYVVKAGFIPGADEMMKAIYAAGYTIALVADGENKSFDNVYEENGLRYCFVSWVVSETIGVQKPGKEMFQEAMDQLGLNDGDKHRIVMVGNNLRKDVLGANQFGITSVWIDWSPRYFHEPRSGAEKPDYTIHTPAELKPLLDTLEAKLEKGEKIKG